MCVTHLARRWMAMLAPAIVLAGAVSAAYKAFPSASGEETITATIKVSGTFDCGMKRYVPSGLGNGGSGETQLPVFEVADGGTVQNCIIGAPGADGIHCLASCTLRDVWWEDVGEDAATLVSSAPASSLMHVIGGGAQSANDKIFQHNGGGNVVIESFYANGFGKLYRSCGNCKSGYQGTGPRYVEVKDTVVEGGGASIVGINSNYGDVATLTTITVVGDPNRKLKICTRYQGNNSGAEPVQLGSGPDMGCEYSTSDITYVE